MRAAYSSTPQATALTLRRRPGCGGTQRLIRAVGKSKAMLLCLTGDHLSAEEAEKAGLVAHVYPADELVDKAIEKAAKIASFSKPVAAMVKETVNAAEQLPLDQGLRFERRLFHSTFAMVRPGAPHSAATRPHFFPAHRRTTAARAWAPSSRSASLTSRTSRNSWGGARPTRQASRVALYTVHIPTQPLSAAPPLPRSYPLRQHPAVAPRRHSRRWAGWPSAWR